jgi:hypothetical protein
MKYTRKYAIIYIAVPLSAEEGEAPPNEDDAQAIGEAILRGVPLYGATLVGTRLTSNDLVAPAVSRIPV